MRVSHSSAGKLSKRVPAKSFSVGLARGWPGAAWMAGTDKANKVVNRMFFYGTPTFIITKHQNHTASLRKPKRH